MFGCAFLLSVNVPVCDILHGDLVSKEDAVIYIGVSCGRTIFGFLAGDLCAEGDKAIKGRCTSCPLAIGGVIDGAMVCAVVQPYTMEEGITPKFDTKSGGV